MTLKKDAVIRISSVQDGDKEKQIEVVSKGLFSKENDEYIATYEETELSGMGNTMTTFRIGEDYFGLKREGDTNTNMYFKKGKSTSIMYNTPYGGMTLTVKTNKVDIDVDDKGGSISIDYDMIIADEEIINTKLEAKITVNNG